MKKIVFIIFLLISLSISAEKLDKHRFGISLDGGGFPFSGAGASADCIWQLRSKTLGTAGGSFFYQLHFSKMFAFRPEIGLYTYFFEIYGEQAGTLKGKTQATLTGKIGLTLICYFYTGKLASGYVSVTPYVSSRFWDSAGNKSDGGKVLEENYLSGGVQTAIGFELTNANPVGAGVFFLTRAGDNVGTEENDGVFIMTFGVGISIFM